MIKRYSQMFSDFNELIDFLNSNEKIPTRAIRVNTLKISPSMLIKRLRDRGFKIRQSKVMPEALLVDYAPHALSSTPEYLLGYYFIQELASMIPPYILSPKEDEYVLDMCAAPGGKTTHLAQIMKNKGIIFAVDISNKRIEAMKSNLKRLGVTNTIVLQFNAKNISLLGIKYDKILLDAPCTGEGLIPIDKRRKWSRSEYDIHFMSQIQYTLITAGIRVLKKGGILVYSTCSTAPEENEFVISKLLEENNNIFIEDISIPIGRPGYTCIFSKKLNQSLKKCRRFFPHTDGTIGFFVCKLRKLGD